MCWNPTLFGTNVSISVLLTTEMARRMLDFETFNSVDSISLDRPHLILRRKIPRLVLTLRVDVFFTFSSTADSRSSKETLFIPVRLTYSWSLNAFGSSNYILFPPFSRAISLRYISISTIGVLLSVDVSENEEVFSSASSVNLPLGWWRVQHLEPGGINTPFIWWHHNQLWPRFSADEAAGMTGRCGGHCQGYWWRTVNGSIPSINLLPLWRREESCVS